MPAASLSLGTLAATGTDSRSGTDLRFLREVDTDGAINIFSTFVEAQSGQETSPLPRCSSKATELANQASNGCPSSQDSE
jgi:hypothetical protein